MSPKTYTKSWPSCPISRARMMFCVCVGIRLTDLIFDVSFPSHLNAIKFRPAQVLTNHNKAILERIESVQLIYNTMGLVRFPPGLRTNPVLQQHILSTLLLPTRLNWDPYRMRKLLWLMAAGMLPRDWETAIGVATEDYLLEMGGGGLRQSIIPTNNR